MDLKFYSSHRYYDISGVHTGSHIYKKIVGRGLQRANVETSSLSKDCQKHCLYVVLKSGSVFSLCTDLL